MAGRSFGEAQQSDSMAVPPTEPGRLRAVIETLLKPFTLILTALAERIGKRLKRKPTLHIYVRPDSMIWYACETYNPMMPMMGAHFLADITNDGNEGVRIVDGYFKRTKSQDPFRERIDIPPGATILGKYII